MLIKCLAKKRPMSLWFSCMIQDIQATGGHAMLLQDLQSSANYLDETSVRRSAFRWFQWMTFIAPCNSFQLEMFPMCDARWCLQRSRTNCSYGVAINPEMDNEWFKKESPFRTLKFSFSRKQRKASGKNQNIRRFCANSCLGIVPSEIHVKSRCSNLSNWNRNMAMTPCSL